jgi:hypothetical protein
MIIISADDARAAAGGASALPHAARERGARTGEEIKVLVPPAQERRSRSWCARLQIS